MIYFSPLKDVNKQFLQELKEEACNIIDSGWYILGEKLKSFEDNLASYIGTKYAIGVGNGYDAISIILKSYIQLGLLNIGDEVIIPANSFVASALPVVNCGLKPVFGEPNNQTFNLDANTIKEVISPKTKAIIWVHLYGRVSSFDEINNLAKEHKLLLIEDNAQAIGAEYKGIKTGALGDAAAFSFYPTKNLGAMGDGGAISTNNKALYEVAKAIRNYGSENKYEHKLLGVNSRLDEIQAAFLNVKLKYLDVETSKRRNIAKYYLDKIKNPLIQLPQCDDELQHVWHLFVIRCKQRKELQNYLNQQNIQTLIHYPKPIHEQEAFAGYNSDKMQNTIYSEILSIPLYSNIPTEHTIKIVDALNSFSV